MIMCLSSGRGGDGMKFVYYSAEWCRPCKRVWPWVRSVAEKVGADVEKVDVSSNGVEGILSVPTLDIKVKGETLKRIVRWSGPKALMREVEELL